MDFCRISRFVQKSDDVNWGVFVSPSPRLSQCSNFSRILFGSFDCSWQLAVFPKTENNPFASFLLWEKNHGFLCYFRPLHINTIFPTQKKSEGARDENKEKNFLGKPTMYGRGRIQSQDDDKKVFLPLPQFHQKWGYFFYYHQNMPQGLIKKKPARKNHLSGSPPDKRREIPF